MKNEIKMDMGKLMKENLVVTLRVTGVRRLKFRLWMLRWMLRLSFALAGLRHHFVEIA